MKKADLGTDRDKISLGLTFTSHVKVDRLLNPTHLQFPSSTKAKMGKIKEVIFYYDTTCMYLGEKKNVLIVKALTKKLKQPQ